MDLPVILNDRYKLIQRLGEGGMAEVYQGEDTRLGREVAIKMLRPQYAADQNFLQRFLNEGRAVANFNHANIVNVYDIGRDGRQYYIVMEYVPGADLRDLIQKRGRLEVKEALEIARKIALGVGCAHKAGVVHRDIKPGNVLISPTNDVKVADFGIAKAMAGANLTEPGIVWGTTAYLSPEQIRGEPATPASDVYSIGVVLYEMLTGVVPFAGDDRVAVALQHLRERPVPVIERNHQVPRGVQHLVDRTLEKEPDQRFQDANALAEAIQHYLRTGATGTVSRQSPPDAARLPVPETPVLPPAVGASGGGGGREPVRARPRAEEGGRSGAAPRAQQAATNLPQAEPVDPWSVILAIILVVMIIGLFPLYWLVYEQYFGPIGLAPLGNEVASLSMKFLL